MDDNYIYLPPEVDTIGIGNSAIVIIGQSVTLNPEIKIQYNPFTGRLGFGVGTIRGWMERDSNLSGASFNKAVLRAAKRQGIRVKYVLRIKI